MDNPPGKTKAVIAYFTFIGTLIAFYMNKEDKHAFATWHIKNMFGLLLGQFGVLFFRSFAFFELLNAAMLTLWLFCLLMAILGKKQGIPYLSEKFQDWFKFLD